MDSALTVIHAAQVVAVGGSCTDEKLEQSLVPHVAEINNRLLSSSIDVRSFWDELVRTPELSDSVDEACQTALVAAGCSELQVEQTGRGILRQLDDCRLAVNARFPRLSEQLELRSRPLKERWDTVGRGLVKQIAKQIWSTTPPTNWWPASVTIRLVQPVRGGDGGMIAGENPSNAAIWIEAMLTDASPRVPEVLRVAWLLTRLAIEHHLIEKQPSPEMALAWELASVPLVLRAAAEFDITRAESLPIAEAMEVWRLRSPAGTIKRVESWWREFENDESPLPASLKDLSRSLSIPA